MEEINSFNIQSMKKVVGMENSKEAVFIPKNGIPIYWAKHWSFDHKEYSVG